MPDTPQVDPTAAEADEDESTALAVADGDEAPSDELDFREEVEELIVHPLLSTLRKANAWMEGTLETLGGLGKATLFVWAAVTIYAVLVTLWMGTQDSNVKTIVMALPTIGALYLLARLAGRLSETGGWVLGILTVLVAINVGVQVGGPKAQEVIFGGIRFARDVYHEIVPLDKPAVTTDSTESQSQTPTQTESRNAPAPVQEIIRIGGRVKAVVCRNADWPQKECAFLTEGSAKQDPFDLGWEPKYGFAEPGWAIVGINPRNWTQEYWRIQEEERVIGRPGDRKSNWVQLKTYP